MSLHHLPINNRRWAALRRQVFKRDGFRCRECGRPGRLECDLESRHRSSTIAEGDEQRAAAAPVIVTEAA